MRITGVDILDWMDVYRRASPEQDVYFDVDACMEGASDEGSVIVEHESDIIPKAHEIASLGEAFVKESFKRFEEEGNRYEIVYNVSQCDKYYDMMTIYLSCLADLHKKDFNYMVTYIFDSVEDYIYFCNIINDIRDMISCKNYFLWIRLISRVDIIHGKWQGY